MIVRIIALFLMTSNSLQAINKNDLLKVFNKQKQYPFSYNLGIKIIASKKNNAPITICCHGYGGSNAIVTTIHSFNVIPDHLIGFNFPDYGITPGNYDYTKSTLGSIAELLPLLYVIKQCVIDAHEKQVNLYGFSAGGGAIVNALAVLNTSNCDAQLANIGITKEYKKRIITVLENGSIILDCPLKSMEEIIALRGNSEELSVLAHHYAHNQMRPIDALHNLKGLALTILLYFQDPDEIIGNKDDGLFVDRLSQVNKGLTRVIMHNDGGHNRFHASLWNYYCSFRNKDTV